MSNQRDVLQQEAEARGFIVEWSNIELPTIAKERYKQWISGGNEMMMGQLNRSIDTRFDPRERIGWAQSVMILSAPHAFPEQKIPDDGIRIGRVGRVFWVREQEFTLNRIDPVVEELKDICYKLGGRCRDYVEQGPPSFRSFAANSGMGWIGRNGMLLNKRQGSYMTLAILITSFPAEELEQSTHHHCGTCITCVQKCPTNALLGDGSLETNKCISYWTTNHPDPIPIEKWAGINDWVFGCDICQQVCPWNNKAENFWKGFEPEPDLAHPNLLDFLLMSEVDFRNKYKFSSFERIGRSQMARNSLIVLSNTKNPEYLPLVQKKIADESPLVRASAATALVRMGDYDTARKLLDDPSDMVQASVKEVLKN